MTYVRFQPVRHGRCEAHLVDGYRFGYCERMARWTHVATGYFLCGTCKRAVAAHEASAGIYGTEGTVE